MIKKNDFDGISTPEHEHPTNLVASFVNEKGQHQLIFRSFTTTDNNYDILFNGVKIGYPIPTENISEYKKITGKEINEKIIPKVTNPDDTYSYTRPRWSALNGNYGCNSLIKVGYIYDKNGILKAQFVWETFYSILLDNLYVTHRVSFKEQHPGNIKDFTTEKISLNPSDTIEIYDLENKTYIIKKISDIYLFNSNQRKYLEKFRKFDRFY